MMNPNTIAAIAMTIVAVLQVLLATASLKVGSNSLLGLRLPWTMKNKKIWHVSQQIGFVTAVTTSIGVLVMAWTIKDNPLLIMLLGVGMIVMNATLISIFTYLLSKKDEYRSEK